MKMFAVRASMAHGKPGPHVVNYPYRLLTFSLPCATENTWQRVFVVRHDIRRMTNFVYRANRCRAAFAVRSLEKRTAKALLGVFSPFPCAVAKL
jgi:hypothetical protein